MIYKCSESILKYENKYEKTVFNGIMIEKAYNVILSQAAKEK